MRRQLQELRDRAAEQCRVADEHGDRDSADAWEEIELAIDQCQKSIAKAWAVVTSRETLGEHVARQEARMCEATERLLQVSAEASGALSAVVQLLGGESRWSKLVSALRDKERELDCACIAVRLEAQT